MKKCRMDGVQPLCFWRKYFDECFKLKIVSAIITAIHILGDYSRRNSHECFCKLPSMIQTKIDKHSCKHQHQNNKTWHKAAYDRLDQNSIGLWYLTASVYAPDSKCVFNPVCIYIQTRKHLHTLNLITFYIYRCI